MDKTYPAGMAPKAKPRPQPDRLQQYSAMQGMPPPQGEGLDLSVENMLAQALAMRSSATLQQAAEKDAGFRQQLAMRERTRPLKLDVGPAQVTPLRPPAKLDVGPVEVDGGTVQMGRSVDYRDLGVKPRAHPLPASVQDQSPVDGMPVYSKADSLGRQTHASNIAAMTERGQAAPPHMYQGLTPEDIMGALGMGGDMRAMGGPPSLSGVPSPADAPGKYGDGVYRGEPLQLQAQGYRDPQQHGEALDGFVQKHGYVPEMFADKTPDEAMMMLARQLEAQRARQGDLSAWSTNI